MQWEDMPYDNQLTCHEKVATLVESAAQRAIICHDCGSECAAPFDARLTGPGYGVVQCPHCAVYCVVALGDMARTGCGACLRPLGTQPLIRMDCHVLDSAELD